KARPNSDDAYPWLMAFQERAEAIVAMAFPCTDDSRAGAPECFPAVCPAACRLGQAGGRLRPIPDGPARPSCANAKSLARAQRGTEIAETPADFLAGASAMPHWVSFSYPLRASRALPHSPTGASAASRANKESVTIAYAGFSSPTKTLSSRPTALRSERN